MGLSLAGVDVVPLRQHADRRVCALKEQRLPVIDYCTKIAEELLPTRLPYLRNPYERIKGGEQNEHIVHAVGYQSLQAIVAGVISGSMPATSEWYHLMVRGQWDYDRDTAHYLQELELRQRTAHNQSNANQALGMFATELIAFGTAAALFLEDEEDYFRIDTCSMGEYMIAEDAHYRPDTLFREYTLTVGQLAQEFGVDRLSPQAKHLYKRQHYDEPIEVVHAIEPDRDALNPHRSSALPWRSYYYENGSSSDLMLGIRGFRHFPCLVTRWGRMPGTAYGYGRGGDALPHLVRLRKMLYRYGQGLAFKVQPALQLPPGVQEHEVRMLPGGMTPVLGTQPITTLFDVATDLREFDAMLQSTVQDVRDSLGASLVASLRGLQHQMTAREVDTRTTQDLMEFLPAVYQLFDELIGPLVELEWQALADAGQLPEPPSSLPDRIDIEYTSPLARKQRHGEVDAIVRVFTLGGELSKLDPSVLDNLDFDAALRRVAEIEGCPVQAIRQIEALRDLRDARGRMEQAQAQVAAAGQGIELARSAGEAQQTLQQVA